MSPNINILSWIGSMILIMLPIEMNAQQQSREEVLINDISRLGKRAEQDNVITESRRKEIESFVRDSLPESIGLRIPALEKIRDELDEQYAEMVRQSQKSLKESAYPGRQMLPERLYEPEGYESHQEKRQARESAAIAAAGIDKEEMLKHIRPLAMKPWLRTTLRLLFGIGVNQRPERGDYTVVPQMGRVYDIIMPGGRPDDSWRDAPEMYYDPHPDKHFRR